MKDMYPHVAHLQRELKSTKVKVSGQEDSIVINDDLLISLLPERNVADQLVQIYIDNMEKTYRILHIPSFCAEYSVFWSNTHGRRPAFTALLLLIMATTNSVNRNGSSLYRGDSSVKRETAILWIRKCDSWLQSQSQKHVNITTFQLHCLSFIAKQTNCFKRKRTWTSAGVLLRLAISAGLHRDASTANMPYAASSNKKISTFDGEMRRRIWTTILELELYAALERGMPAMMEHVFEDCGYPMNLEDEEFDQSTEHFPSSKPMSRCTRSSFQCLSRSSWSLRAKLMSLINDPRSQMPYEHVLIYDEEIVEHLENIPCWNDSEGLVPQTLLQLQLHRLRVLLHRPYARAEPRCSRYEYSAIVHYRSAVAILDFHQQLSQTDNCFLYLLRNDIAIAALSICYTISTDFKQGKSTTQNQRMDF